MGAVLGAEFAAHRLDMQFHGDLLQTIVAGNLLVGLARTDAAQNVQFPATQQRLGPFRDQGNRGKDLARQHGPDSGDKVARTQRLGHETGSAHFQRGSGSIGRDGAGNQRDRTVAIGGDQPGQPAEPIHARHVVIGQNQIERGRRNQTQRMIDIRGQQNLFKTFGLQIGGDRLADQIVVVGDQNSRHCVPSLMGQNVSGASRLHEITPRTGCGPGCGDSLGQSYPFE